MLRTRGEGSVRTILFLPFLAMTTAAACGGGGTTSTGSLFVTVSGASGPVAGATVSTMPATQSMTTDALGTVFFSAIAAGGYAITAVHPTAGSGRVAGEVTANDVVRLTITLTPGVTVPTTGTGGVSGQGGVSGAAGRGGSTGTGGMAGHGGSLGTGGSSVGTGGTATGGAGTGGAGGAGGASGSLVLNTPTKDLNGVNLSWTATPTNAFATYRIYRSST